MNAAETLTFDASHGPAPSSELVDRARQARDTLERGDGPGGDLTGWLELPTRIGDELTERIEQAAAAIRESEVLVVVGIGGSQLGAQAAIDALVGDLESPLDVRYAGHQLDAGYHARLIRELGGVDFALNAISKSGGTTEPAVAFRLLRKELEGRGNDVDLARRIFVTTGPTGALRELATARGLTTFEVPDDVGGRFSVLTPVGLLPIAAAGVDIRELLAGAAEMAGVLRAPDRDDPGSNPAIAYAAFRHAAAANGRLIEVLACNTPRLRALAGWWKQLFGESEGKDGKGILPTTVDLSTDLHSLGQWLQDGPPVAFETAIDLLADDPLVVPKSAGTQDGLDQLAGRPIHEINRAALEASLAAHASRGTPCAKITLPRLSAHTLGALFYFFEYSCGVSAYMLGVNPFDQPGVEAYKGVMRELLGRK